MAWTSEQLNNAHIIQKVGRQLGASSRDIQIAIMAAIVESGLRNVNYGDRDSIGMFQQRNAWGSRSARLDPYQSSKMFFLGGADGQRGLLDIHNRGSLSMGVAAQTVQVSGYPDRYAQHQSEAASLLGKLGGGGGGGGGSRPGSDTVTPYSQQMAAQYAASHPQYAASHPAPKGTKGSQSFAPQTHLGDIPGLDTITNFSNPGRVGSIRPQDQADPPPSLVNGVGEMTADSSGIGEVSFGRVGDDPSGDSPVDTPRFGVPLEDPMAGIKMPTLGQLHQTTQTTTDFNFPDNATAAANGFKPGDDGVGNPGVVGIAKKFLGTPYVWGGTQPSGFDCSGFVQYVYGKMGKKLPRLSADQARSGPRIKLSDLKPGDLVGWDNSSRNVGADHIAIYIGGGKIIEAPRPGSHVQISNLYDTGRAWGVRM